MRVRDLLRFGLGVAVVAGSAAAFAPTPAVAQQAKSHSVMVIDPASSHLRKALNSLSPVLAAAARWQTAEEADDGALKATSVTIEVPWRHGRLTADALSINADQMSLEGVRLENGRGTFEASRMRGTKPAWEALAAFAFPGAKDSDMEVPTEAGKLHISDFTIAATSRRRDDRHFSSSWRGKNLDVGGLHCVTGGEDEADACGILGVDRLAAAQLSAETSFAGQARLRADSLAFSMSGAGAGAWTDPAAVTTAFARKPDTAGAAIGGDVTIRNLHLTTSRSASDDPSEVVIETARFALDRPESGGIKLDGTLTSRFSPNVLKGTQFWPAITEQTSSATTAGPDGLLPLSAAVAATYEAGTFTLSRLKANVAELLTLDASADMSGLKRALTRSEGADAPSGLSGLMSIAVSSFSLAMHDQGMTRLVKTAFGESPAALVRQAGGVPAAGDGGDAAPGDGDASASNSLMNLMMGDGNMKAGLKSIVRTAAVERISAILDDLATKGSVKLECQSTPACISLAIGSQN